MTKIYKTEEGLRKTVTMINGMLSSGVTPVIVLIAGGTASGKTTFARRVKEAFDGEAMIIPLDDYFKGEAYVAAQNAKGKRINFDHPDYVDFDTAKSHLKEISSGNHVVKPVFNFKKGEPDGFEEITPQKVVILEGILSLKTELREHGHITIFVEASAGLRFKRRLERDLVRTRMTKEQIEKYFTEVTEPMYQEHALPTKDHASILISTDE